jgi:hypothetical protein
MKVTNKMQLYRLIYYFLSALLSLGRLSPSTFRGLVFGLLAFFFFLVMSEELARCFNPQPEGPGDFWSRFSFCSPR